MKEMTLLAAAKACGGKLVIPIRPSTRKQAEGVSCEALKKKTMIRSSAGSMVKGVVLDSRKIEPGFLFIATKGERVDGHKFIPDVFEKGAVGVVCQDEPQQADGPYILVKDSFQALKDIASYYRETMPVPVVGITGSVGKTSTKEFIAAVLAQKYKVHKTEGNYNNEVGVPLTLLAMPEDTEMAVIEMGINHFGEMHRLSQIVLPDICVMTNIGECHLEFLGSRQGILKAKSEMFDFMNPQGSVCVNGDDDMLSTISEVHGKKPLRFGLSSSNDIYADEIVNKGLLGSEATIHVKTEGREEKFSVSIPLPGIHMVYNALAATAAGLISGLCCEEIARGIASVSAVGGRSRVVNVGDFVLIDDCYNANPVSMEAALDLLTTAEGRKIAVLGDMFELGSDEKALHARVGAYAAEKNIDCLICAGSLSEEMAKAAREAGMKNVFYFADTKALEEGLFSLIKKGDTILVKASHGMGYSAIVKMLEN